MENTTFYSAGLVGVLGASSEKMSVRGGGSASVTSKSATLTRRGRLDRFVVVASCTTSQVRYKTMAPSTLLRNEAEVSVTDAQLSAVFSGDALDNDSDLSGLAEDAPVIIW